MNCLLCLALHLFVITLIEIFKLLRKLQIDGTMNLGGPNKIITQHIRFSSSTNCNSKQPK